VRNTRAAYNLRVTGRLQTNLSATGLLLSAFSYQSRAVQQTIAKMRAGISTLARAGFIAYFAKDMDVIARPAHS